MRNWLIAVLVLAGWAASATAAAPAKNGLRAFRSESELKRFLAEVVAAQKRDIQPPSVVVSGAPLPPPPPPPPAPAPAPEVAASADQITNVQIAGVDEGSIVKARGDLLVVLRRGRLFTVSTAGKSLRPVAAIEAYPPGADGRGDWYDELLLSEDWVIVIGYSYSRGGSQISRFRLSETGELRFVDAHAFRSADYYSGTNYASRLIGGRLILYAPIPLQWDAMASPGPAYRRWDPGERQLSPFRPLGVATRTYVPAYLRANPGAVSTIHSVTECDVTAPQLRCDATAVLGSSARTFFVSGNAVYIWSDFVTGPDGSGDRAFVYRLPLDGSRPQGVRASGQPLDQFSFYPDEQRQALQVVVMEYGGGDTMFAARRNAPRGALVTIPMASFGSGEVSVPRDNYQELPDIKPWLFKNRFVSDHLLWSGSDDQAGGRLHILSLRSREVTSFDLPAGVTRLDAIGPDAVAIGGGRDALSFTAIDLSGPEPRIAADYRLPGGAEGESRSQAFFFRPDPNDPGGRNGLLALPVRRGQQGYAGFGPSAAITFLRRGARTLDPVGELAAGEVGTGDDRCVASCVDWYGNARPIFLRDRVFALLGYELVEGGVQAGRIAETGRADFSRLLRGGPAGTD